VLAAATLPICACQSSDRVQGRAGIVASYAGRTLHARLPDAVRVPGAHYAARAALVGRGYTLEADEVTTDEGRLVATAPRSALTDRLDRVEVRTRLTPSRVGVRVTTQPLPDEVLARAILDDVLVRLGM